jgi:single-stranded DNA-binding protein
VSKFNTIIVFGWVNKDATIEEVEGHGHKASFPISVIRPTRKDKDNKYDNFWVECWHDFARGAEKYCRKDNKVLVKGLMKSQRVETDDGWKTYTGIIADFIGFDISIPKDDKQQEDDDENIPF